MTSRAFEYVAAVSTRGPEDSKHESRRGQSFLPQVNSQGAAAEKI
jgi:hypothetical protein